MRRSILILHLLLPAILASHQAARSDTLTIPVAVSAGWNLLTLPVEPENPSTASLFPSAISPAFLYTGLSYAEVDSIPGGEGFWIKFAVPETIQLTGSGRFHDTLELTTGWNMVGGPATPLPISKVRTIHDTLRLSRWYMYAPGAGYVPTETLEPGRGYIVKSPPGGKLVMTSFDAACPAVSSVSYGGKEYPTVQIGAQCWLRKNLDIGEIEWAGLDHEDDGVIEKYCWIDEQYNCDLYGALYQWGEAMQYSTLPGARGVCPPGWHIPTLGEFQYLDTVTGGNENHLKALLQGNGNGAGTNLTGFSALLSGYRQLDGMFSLFGYQTYYWTSSQQPGGKIPGLYFFYAHSDFYFYNLEPGYGMNIRCLKD